MSTVLLIQSRQSLRNAFECLQLVFARGGRSNLASGADGKTLQTIRQISHSWPAFQPRRKMTKSKMWCTSLCSSCQTGPEWTGLSWAWLNHQSPTYRKLSHTQAKLGLAWQGKAWLGKARLGWAGLLGWTAPRLGCCSHVTIAHHYSHLAVVWNYSFNGCEGCFANSDRVYECNLRRGSQWK